jgi:PAS domain S-box-containing protein
MAQKKPRPEDAQDPVLALGTTESLYEAIVQSAADAIFTKSLDGTIASWNAGAERLYGYKSAEIVGRSVGVLAPPEQVDEIPALLVRIAAGERIEHFETVRARRDGSLVDVSLTISPIRDADGRVVGASSVARDIGARKTAERVLAESEERFRAVLEASPTAMFGVGPDGRITYANPEATSRKDVARSTSSSPMW